MVGCVEGSSGGRNDEPRGVRGFFAHYGFGNGVDDFAGLPDEEMDGGPTPPTPTGITGTGAGTGGTKPNDASSASSARKRGFARDPTPNNTEPTKKIRDSTGRRAYFDAIIAQKPPSAPFGSVSSNGSGLLLSGLLLFSPKATPVTIELDLQAAVKEDGPGVGIAEAPVSHESLSSAVWTIISVWQRVAFPLWEGRLVAVSGCRCSAHLSWM